MKKFSALVVDKSGNKKKITESAISKTLLEADLHSQGYYIIKIEDFKEPAIELVSSKIGRKEILDLSYNIFSLLDFGLDINEAFTILQKVYVKGRLNTFVKEIAESLNKGETLYNSIKESKQGESFDRFILTMISSGEISGRLPDSFRLIYRYLKNGKKLQDKIVAASIYPSILLVMAFASVNLFIFVILPLFKSIYDNMNFEPKLLIRSLFKVSNFFVENMMGYLVVLFLLILGAALLLRIPVTRAAINSGLTKLPLVSTISSLQKKINVSFSLEILLKGGATLEEGLYKLFDLELDKELKKAYDSSIAILKNGGTIKQAFEQITFFSPRDLSIIEISESVSRSLEGFEKIYQDAQIQLESTFEAMIQLAEPVILVLMAVFIFFVLYMVVSPTLDMLQSANF